MSGKLSHIKKIFLAVVLISFPILLLLWAVGSGAENDNIAIRVLFVSYSGDTLSSEKPTVVVLSSQKKSVVVIDINEWDLPIETQESYRNNIILECTSKSFPVHWNFLQRVEQSGPSMTIYSSRIVDRFSEKSSYRFISTAYLMPYKEISTGKYDCDDVNTSKNFSNAENYFYIYFTGRDVFLSHKNISIESKNDKELIIPCPVSTPTVPISLYLDQNEEEILISAPNDSYTTYNPQEGFTLSTKFLEEKDPWGRFICRVSEDPNLRSGYISIVPPKDYIVNVTPPNSTVLLNGEDFDGKFICEAKESITLQVSKIKKFRVISYKMNGSWEFPFVAKVQYELKDLKDFSSITCRTNRGAILHTWKFTSSTMSTVSMSFQYDETASEFACCSQNAAKMKPSLQILDCGSPLECSIRQSCFKHKECETANKNMEDMVDCKIVTVSQVASGTLQCAVGESFQQLYYFYNGIRLYAEKNFLNFYDLPAEEFMMISTYPQTINNTFSVKTKYKFICKGAKFILAGGFIWFTHMRDGSVREIKGKGYFDQNWIHNWIELFFNNDETTDVYCFAPVLNSYKDWRNVSLQIDYKIRKIQFQNVSF